MRRAITRSRPSTPKRSIAIAEKAPDRDDGALSVNYSNLGKTLSYQGDFEGAEHAHEVAARLAKSTYGADSWYYWVATANQAQTVHLKGDRERFRGVVRGSDPRPPGPIKTISQCAGGELCGACL